MPQTTDKIDDRNIRPSTRSKPSLPSNNASIIQSTSPLNIGIFTKASSKVTTNPTPLGAYK